MSDLADLFPGFESRWIATPGGRVFARIGGDGPPLVLLHGYPQSHVMWHRVAPALAGRFRLVIPDLPGYGSSDVPEFTDDHRHFTKRAMAAAIVAAMGELGHARFALAGHDRGARVAYRMALDHPERLSRLAVLDILPTFDYWARLDRALALRIYHWMFLAQPYPLPETLIGGQAGWYLDRTLASWTARGDLSAFDPRALAHYRAAYADPLRVRAMCSDYRAGAGPDVEHDRADRDAGRSIGCPVLALWGGTGIAARAATPLDAWRAWASDLRGSPVAAGHFLAEENAGDTAAALAAFFGAAV